MKNLLRNVLGLTVLASAITAQAHRAWILPASTVLSSEDPWVTFDAAVSNDIFHTDYRAYPTDALEALSPGGKPVALENAHSGKYRSTFDLHLTERGTYKVFSARNNLSAHWQTAAGERGRYPGRGESFTEEGFANAVPKDAKDLQITQSSRRMEAFVTAGVPDEKVFKPTNEGLEMMPMTHPNDLYAGETAEFKFLIDGEPAANAQITVIPGGMRYRTSQNEITASTNKKGVAKITWPDAGMYWLEAEFEDDKAKAPASKRSGLYVVTLEVLPQ